MGFDPIQHAMCDDNVKQEIKKHRLFGVDTYTASTEKAGSAPDCQAEMVSDGQTIGLANCYRFSNLAPSDSDILGAEIVMTYSGAPLLTATSKEVLGTNGKATIFTFSDPESGMEPPAVFLVSVREAGAYDVDANVGFTMRFNFPQTGLYYVTMGEPLGGGVAITMKWETIHPIDQKFLPPGRYLLNLSSVTIQQGDSVIHPSIYDFVALAAQNGGSFNTTIPAENCKELVTKATEWAKLSRGEDWNWLTSAPQLVVCDNIGILLMPTAIEHQHSTDPGLLQIFVGGTLRVKNGTTWITTNANCTIFFNEDGSVEFFVTATAV